MRRTRIFAYFTALALLDYGYKKEAQKVMADVVSNIARQYEKQRCFV
ncbi:MAG: hypothetical protein L6V93_18165 [Clostridiales bacterium]|nr:MAG: hypothetical protein L6V93_18165 [Clostridiales bacterium]